MIGLILPPCVFFMYPYHTKPEGLVGAKNEYKGRD